MTPIPVPPAAIAPLNKQNERHPDAKLFAAAQQLEATFLAEMLKSAGLDSQNSAFGGGIGEEQFSSYLRQEQAKEMVAAGGIGLAESLFNAMKGPIHG